MNADQIKGKWKELQGEAKRHWGKLTDDDVQTAEGDRDKLVGKIQQRYGKSKEDAEREVSAWIDKQ
ncbi:CsbD family protein [Maricaulaceae bacterium MS644]